MPENLPTVAKPPINAGAPVAALVPQTLDEAYRLADAMSRSGLTPNGIKTPEAVMVAIMAGAELGLPPFQAVQSFAIINGRPSIWGDAIPALLWSNGFKIREWRENELTDYPDTMVAKCEISRPDGEVIERSFSVADAKEGRLWTKEGPWQTAKKRMLQMRARAFAARDGAADLLRGLFVAEEAADYTAIDNTGQAGTGMVDRLAARVTEVDAAGFNVRNVTEGTAAAPVDEVLDGDNVPAEGGAKPARRRRRTKAEMEAARAAGEPEPANDGDNTTADDETAPGMIYTDYTEGPNASGGGGGGPQADAVPDADAPSEPEAATDASAPTTETEAGTPPTGDATSDDRPPPRSFANQEQYQAQARAEFRATTKGHAKAGATYHLEADPVHENGTRPVYKDGVLAGHAKARDRWSVYAEHAPEVAKPGAVEETKSPPTSAASPAQADSYLPSVDVGEFVGKLARANSYQAVRLAMGSFRRTRAFQETEPEGQREWQGQAFDRLDALRDSGVAGVPTHTEEPWIFGLWLVNAPIPEIMPALEALKTGAAYAALTQAQKDGLDEAAKAEVGEAD